MSRILVVTNDFPPRRGGIESFVALLCGGLPAGELVVYTARMPGASSVDQTLPYPVIRDPSPMLLPTPRLARAVRRALVEHGCDRVVFGASAPLGLLAPTLRSAGARRVVALSHGHEVWWSKVPAVRLLLRRIGRHVDVVTYVSEHCRRQVARALRPGDAAAMTRLVPGVDTAVFRPGLDGSPLRRTLEIAAARPLVLAASRLVARKGHDVLIQAWPAVLSRHPAAVLVIVGDGPMRNRLLKGVRELGLDDSVRLVPGLPWVDMPQMYAAADVFALPCRTRLAGLEPEALGIVFLEAAACGLPVLVGRSGGAPETVLEGQTGYVVDPRSAAEVAARVCALLDDPGAAAAMGARGREWVARGYSPAIAVQTLRRLLAVDP